jgi:hypothetical protein
MGMEKVIKERVKRYKTKPVVIEALLFNGENAIQIFDFIGDYEARDCIDIHTTDNPVIKTLEGNMLCTPGDYVIKGLRGEFYPCKPDVFKQKYEQI